VNKEASHYVRLFGGSKTGNLIFCLPLIQAGPKPPAKTMKPSKKPVAFLLYIGEQIVVL
jgi:hypothetical protein